MSLSVMIHLETKMCKFDCDVSIITGHNFGPKQYTYRNTDIHTCTRNQTQKSLIQIIFCEFINENSRSITTDYRYWSYNHIFHCSRKIKKNEEKIKSSKQTQFVQICGILCHCVIKKESSLLFDVHNMIFIFTGLFRPRNICVKHFIQK